jgi:uncharacterized membrane protein
VHTASQVAACLVASFVGGSVNFFATAAAIHADKTSPLFGAMASADILVMALYFAILSAAVHSKRLRLWFEGEHALGIMSDDQISVKVEHKEVVCPEYCASGSSRQFIRLAAGCLVSSLAFGFVEIAKSFESALNRFVPGTACAFLSATIPSFAQFLPARNLLWNEMQLIAKPLSSVSFLFLFASVGISADLKAALQNGPACLLFSVIALTLHGVVTVLGAWLYRKRGRVQVRWTDVLVASNAAIGGPATAAAFCGQMHHSNQTDKYHITVAATVWGVAGYALGTTIGVTFYRFLNAMHGNVG